MVIESELSVIWDTKKCKRFPQEIAIKLVLKNIRRVHI